jgi:hypothetical protein
MIFVNNYAHGNALAHRRTAHHASCAFHANILLGTESLRRHADGELERGAHRVLLAAKNQHTAGGDVLRHPLVDSILGVKGNRKLQREANRPAQIGFD